MTEDEKLVRLHELWQWVFSAGDALADTYINEFAYVNEFADILCAYSEPHRFYHTTDHLLDFALKIDSLGLQDFLPDRQRAAAFIFYHDYFYQTDSIPNIQTNEAQSARHAADELQRMGADPGMAESVATLILATKTHDIDAAADPEGAILIDLDMSILGADPDRYDAYTRQIRQEFIAFPDQIYYAARRDLLIETILASDNPIFKTPQLRAIFEDQARANLRREQADIQRLLALRAGPSPS